MLSELEERLLGRLPHVGEPLGRNTESQEILFGNVGEEQLCGHRGGSGERQRGRLRRRGHETHIARDGNQGLAITRSLRPDVVLLDIGLPGLDGYEVARRLRAQADREGTQLVAVSGYGQEADRRRASEAGFDLHLVKPVRIEELGRILADVPPRLRPT